MTDRRVVLVTGAANGIGWATARRFATQGDVVALADIDGQACTARAEELGAEHLALQADVSGEEAAGMVQAVIRRFGRIDVLVNNAGRVDPRATPAVDQDESEFCALLAVNLHGTFRASQAAARAMAEQGGGVIVNTASGAGIVAVPRRNAYAAAKAGVIGLTRSCAREWAAQGVRVNAVAPGYVRTEIIDSLVRAGKVELGQVERRIPLGRLGRPDEIAAVTCFLCSADGAQLSGGLFVADGGYLAFGGTQDASTGGGRQPVMPTPRVIVIAGADGMAQRLADEFAAMGDTVMCTELGEHAVAQAARLHGRIDVLVTLPVWSDGPDFAAQVDTVVIGSFLACRTAATFMLAQGSGSIVIVAPAAVADDAMAGEAARDGLIMLARSLACEWADRGVRVNAAKAPLGMAPESVLGMVRFLASEDASYVTGSSFGCDALT